MRTDHPEIWLEPDCCADHAGVGRTWCQDDVYECEHGVEPTHYIREDIMDDKLTEIARIRLDLESELNKARDEIQQKQREYVDLWDSKESLRKAILIIRDFIAERHKPGDTEYQVVNTADRALRKATPVSDKQKPDTLEEPCENDPSAGTSLGDDTEDTGSASGMASATSASKSIPTTGSGSSPGEKITPSKSQALNPHGHASAVDSQLQDRYDVLHTAICQIAGQKLSDEMQSTECADFEYGYNEIIRVARMASDATSQERDEDELEPYDYHDGPID